MIKSFFSKIISNNKKTENKINDPLVNYIHKLISQWNPEDNLLKKIEEATFIVLDTETTGLDKKKDKILSIAAAKLKGNTLLDIYNVFIDAKVKIPEESIKFHGIENKHLKNKPKINEILPDFIRFINNGIIVGHHIRFDIDMINKALMRFFNIKLKNFLLDTGDLYNFLTNDDEKVSLDYLIKKFDVKYDEENRHTAMGDVLITSEIFIKILRDYKEKFKHIEDFYHNNLIFQV